MRLGLFLLGLVAGSGLGFAVAAWALYEPVPIGAVKYRFSRSPGPVPAYALDGSKKLFLIECISQSEKDCPQAMAVSIPEPGTLGLLLMGGVLLARRRR